MKKTTVIVALFLLSMVLGGCVIGDRAKACEYAENDIMTKLKSPSTAVFPSCSDQDVTEFEPEKFMIESYYDAQNSFGAIVRGEYLCEIWLVEDNERTICVIF